MSKKATTNAMEELHAKLAQVMKAQLDGDEISPALLSSVAKFLKDNHIEVGPERGDLDGMRKALDDMADMPFDGEVPKAYQ